MKKNLKTLLLALIGAVSIYGCNKTETGEKPTSETKSETSIETSSKEEISSSEELSSTHENLSSTQEEVSSVEQYPEVDLTYRTARNFEKYGTPSNETNEDELPLISNRNYKTVDINDNKALVSKDVRLEFVHDQEKYYVQLVSLKNINETAVAASQEIMFTNKKPVVIYLKGSNETIETCYDSITNTDYGIKAIANITSSAGSTLEVMDCYYFASENEDGALNKDQVMRELCDYSMVLDNCAQAYSKMTNNMVSKQNTKFSAVEEIFDTCYLDRDITTDDICDMIENNDDINELKGELKKYFGIMESDNEDNKQ